MKKALVFNKAWNGRVAGEIERIVEETDVPSIFLLNDGWCDLVDVPGGIDINFAQSDLNEEWHKDHKKKYTITLTQADSHQYDVTIDGNTQSLTSGTGETAADIVANLLLSIAFAGYTLTDNLDGSYTIEKDNAGADFSLSLDANQSESLDQDYHEILTSDPSDGSYTYVSWYTISENTAAKTQADKDSQILTAYQTMNTDVLTQMGVVFGTTNADSAAAYERTWNLMVATPSDWSGAGLTARFAVAGFAIGDALDTDQKITDYATAKVAEVNAYGVWRMQRIETFRTDKAAIEAS